MVGRSAPRCAAGAASPDDLATCTFAAPFTLPRGAALGLCAAALALSACGGGASGPPGPDGASGSGDSTRTAAPPTSEFATPSGHALVGTRWQWVQSTMGDGTIVTPPDASRYTVKLAPDGTVIVQADCNSGTAHYTTDGLSLLTIEPMAVTLMMCEDPSEGALFLQQLQRAESYVIQADRLNLAVVGESGAGTAILTLAPQPGE